LAGNPRRLGFAGDLGRDREAGFGVVPDRGDDLAQEPRAFVDRVAPVGVGSTVEDRAPQLLEDRGVGSGQVDPVVAGLVQAAGGLAEALGQGGELAFVEDLQVGDKKTVTGTLTLTELKLNDAGDGLLASGSFSGEAVPGNSNGNGNSTKDISTTFEDVAANLLPSGDSGVCDVLDLNLGPLDLDVLGLVVNLSEVELNIDAVPGPGNLLGNLLCAVANLLN